MSKPARWKTTRRACATAWAWRLFPDLSQAADAQYGRGGAMRDSVVRLFYVGATRAYEELHVCQRETGMAITL